MMVLSVVIMPVAAALCVLVFRRRQWTPWAGVASSVYVAALGLYIAESDLTGRAPSALSGVLRVDELSAFMIIVIGLVATLASMSSVRYLRETSASLEGGSSHAVQYQVLVQVFVATMLVAVCAANIGVLWVSIEATTVATTFLVGHRRTRHALEASWKYIVICSVGIALAFLGTVLVYLASVHAGASSGNGLEWTWLMGHAHQLDPSVMRLAIGLLILGYGAKAGLVPMHSWLPDAHSQAPAPVSALMSGVLLSVAFYALLRFKAVAVLSIGPSYPRALFVIVALVSLGFASLMLIHQKDLKRALAYSSTEHMALMALGAAAGGPLAVMGVLLHVLGHALAKGVLFLVAGEMVLVDGSSTFVGSQGLLARRPTLGAMFAGALVALLGLPPFSLFISELTMMRGEMSAHLGWAVALSAIALVIAFAAFANHGRRLLFGDPAESSAPTRSSLLALGPLGLALALCAVVGVFVWPLGAILSHAATLVSS